MIMILIRALAFFLQVSKYFHRWISDLNHFQQQIQINLLPFIKNNLISTDSQPRLHTSATHPIPRSASSSTTLWPKTASLSDRTPQTKSAPKSVQQQFFVWERATRGG